MAPIEAKWHHSFIISLIFISQKPGLPGSPSPDSSGNPFVPVPRLLEAQKIGTDSGKKLLKNKIKPKKLSDQQIK
jgi:hypothetical protein